MPLPLRDALLLGTSDPGAATGFNPQLANTVLAGPASGPAGPVTARALVAADIPAIPASLVGPGPAHKVLTDGVTVAWAVAPGKPNYASLTLGGNRTLAITGAADGTTGVLMVTQDATGSRTLALPAGSAVAGGGTGAVTLSVTGGAVDRLTWYFDGTAYWWSADLNFT
jgi:hypothetical protein